MTVKDKRYWLEVQLMNWASWMSKTQLPAGLPKNSCAGMIRGFMVHTSDSDELYESLDLRLAEITHSIINGLERNEREAIYRKYGLRGHFSTSDEFISILESARAHVLIRLVARGVWMG